MGIDLQPSSLAAQPAGLRQPHRKSDFRSRVENLTSLPLQELQKLKGTLRTRLRIAKAPDSVRFLCVVGKSEQRLQGVGPQPENLADRLLVKKFSSSIKN
eukprot:1156931-Pelagomonas_calceolata.AAC.2